ncbi:hypothetical protein MNBD_CHLOROFLEXI01-5106 [hydrothermal vent metagenome]|uniref:NERD domain-containing protein n=1 Tax=hydrothermal vent metagenome TaxID=652676 RepID=A0A3B0UZ67_9ZZZZ
MMARFKEGRLAFTFDDEWLESVVKFDEHRDYQKMATSLSGTKGVDFLGILGGELYFIEVKDFRRYRIQNKKRIADGELTTEVGQKIKDTVACIVGSVRSSSTPEIWQSHCDLLLKKDKPIKGVLWLEEDLPPRGSSSVSQNVLQKELGKKLNWLTVRVDVRSLRETIPQNLHLQVANLPVNNAD